MKYKNIINILKSVMLIMVCVLCVSGSSSSAGAKSKDITTSTGYTVSELNIPYSFKLKGYGQSQDFMNSFAIYNKKLVLQTSACFWGEDNDVYKNYKTTWDSYGKAKTKKGMQIPSSKRVAGRFKFDSEGNSYFVGRSSSCKHELYICNSSGKLINTWKLYNKIKCFTKNKKKQFGVVDYEIQNNRINMLIIEYDFQSGKKVSSVQVFNVNNGKRVKVYKLPYEFDRIDNGYLYGFTSAYDKKVNNYKYPVERGFFKYSIDGKECLWNYDCDAKGNAFDITNNHIIYLNNNGLYIIDTTKQEEPVLIVDNIECSTLKSYYSDIDAIYAINRSTVYIPYHSLQDQGNDDIYMLKIKKE